MNEGYEQQQTQKMNIQKFTKEEKMNNNMSINIVSI